jgi:hypothetical protein
MEYEEEQRMELEALEAILGEEALLSAQPPDCSR